MSLGKQITDNLTSTFNSVYQINRDVSGWDKLTIQVSGAMLGTAYIYGTIDSGASQGVNQGNAALAINHTPIQATNLATGSAVTSITSAGMYTVNAANQQFIRIQGNPAGTPTNVYRILLWQSKTS